MGEYEKAIEAQETSLSLNQEIGDEEGQGVSLHELSILYMLTRETTKALDYSEEAERLFRKLNNEPHIAGVFHQRGLLLTDLARIAQTESERHTCLNKAFKYFKDALIIHERIGDETGIANASFEIGKLWQSNGQFDKALEVLLVILLWVESRQRAL